MKLISLAGRVVNAALSPFGVRLIRIAGIPEREAQTESHVEPSSPGACFFCAALPTYKQPAPRTSGVSWLGYSGMQCPRGGGRRR